MLKLVLRGHVQRLREWRKAILRVSAAYARAHQRRPRLLAPRRFTEKMQWRKLFDLNPLFPVLSDKLAVRSFISERVGDAFLVPLLWAGSPDDIPFDRLSPPYVIKSNHGSGYYIMVGADDEPRPDQLRAHGRQWLTQDFGSALDEPGYVPIQRRLMVEKTVATDTGERPEEVRLFMFDGKVAVINTVFIENGQIRNGTFHTPDWIRLDWHFSRLVDREFSRPKRLSEMLGIAERLAAGLDHVRVDFYDCGERIYVGEMTLYSWSGMSPFSPDAADFLLGAYWRIKYPLFRAASEVSFGRREIKPRPIAAGEMASEDFSIDETSLF